ncbi:MAG TPA: 5-formyltetrahydrofolate cyclo-ligase [Alphaproteobacteria bacterium]|nr:5-formyltetrahydrofolate cyclo-ligase [Alphaproteobacteria bacterium]
MSEDLDPAAAKARLRAEMRRGRAAVPEPALAAEAAALRLIAALRPGPGRVVAGYAAIGSELQAWPALARAHAAGAACALPVVLGAGQALEFRRWSPGAPLVAGAFGAAVPPPDAEPVSPDLVLVPLLAFDRRGWRLGYGGGYYDRTLEALRAAGPVTAVGFGFSAQEAAAVPHEATDQRLDWIVTPEFAWKVEA